MSSKRPRIHFRSLSLPPPPSDAADDAAADATITHSPHFLAALQVMAHVLAPIRKALVHFYMTCRKRDVASLPLEWRTLAALGKVFQETVSSPSGKGDASISIATTASSSSSTSSKENNNGEDDSQQQNIPVSTEQLYPILEECLTKHHKTTLPADATQALQLLLEMVQICTRNMPVTNQLWAALLDQAGMGLIAKQSLVGRKTADGGEMIQRTKRDMCMLWCPLDLPYYSTSSKEEEIGTTLPQLLQQYCSKQPYTKQSNSKKKKKTTTKNYYDFDKQPYDFEVKIPSFGNNGNASAANDDDNNKWKTTRSLQLTSVTAFLFLGIQRRAPSEENGDAEKYGDDADAKNFNHAELTIPLKVDVSKLCDPSAIPKKESKEYQLVGGILYDEGDCVPVLRDEGRVSAAGAAKDNKEKDGGDEEDDEDEDDEAWKLLETEEVIPMSETDVLEFLKGEGGAEGDAPCGTMAIYRRVDTACHDEMNQLLSDIIISQVSGTLNSTADFYIEEEIIEDEEDDDEEEEEAAAVGAPGGMETIQE